MSFHEWMEQAEQFWGPMAMQIFSQYALGQIDFETCVKQMNKNIFTTDWRVNNRKSKTKMSFGFFLFKLIFQ